MGDARPTSQTIIGIGLMGAGLIIKRTGRKQLLYRGVTEPGSGTRIRVTRGSRSIYDGPIGG